MFELNKLISNAFLKTTSVVEKHIKLAKEKGDAFTDKFQESSEFISIKISLEYLHEMSLLSNSEELLTKLEMMTDKWTKMIT